MKKLVYLALLVVAFGAVVVGCQDKDKAAADAAKAEAAKTPTNAAPAAK